VNEKIKIVTFASFIHWWPEVGGYSEIKSLPLKNFLYFLLDLTYKPLMPISSVLLLNFNVDFNSNYPAVKTLNRTLAYITLWLLITQSLNIVRKCTESHDLIILHTNHMWSDWVKAKNSVTFDASTVNCFNRDNDIQMSKHFRNGLLL